MNRPWSPQIRRIVLSVALTGAACLAHAAPPDFTVLPPIDLSPGPDVTEPGSFALNRATHRLYVSSSVAVTAVKVIDTTTNVVIAGVDFGWYGDPTNRFIGWGMAVDDSAGPAGNKLYVVGGPRDRTSFVLRVVDLDNQTNAGEGTDILLPVAPSHEQGGKLFPSVVVNPATHKVYVSTNSGDIVVIDGDQQSVIKTLSPDAGSFLAVDPVANKIFVLGRNGGAIIDGATDTVSAPPEPLVFQPRAASFNEADNRIYVVGSDGNYNGGLFVLDGQTGQLVASRTDFGGSSTSYETQGSSEPVSIAIVAEENAIYLGSETKIYVVNGSDLSRRAELPRSAIALAADPAAPELLYTAIKPEDGAYLSDNSIWLIDRANGGVVSTVTTAYMPTGIALNTRTDRAYIAHNSAELVVLDTDKPALIARVPVPRTHQEGRRIAVSERLDRVYLKRRNSAYSSPQTGAIDVIDGATHQLRSSIPIPNLSVDLAVDDTRGRIYVSAGSTLHVYDAETETLITSVDVGGRSGMMALNPVTGRIYMLTGEDEVTVIDTSSLTPVASVALEKELIFRSVLAVNTTTNKIFVGGDGNVTVVNGATNSVEAVFRTGRDGRPVENIVLDEEADVVYLTDFDYRADYFDQRRIAVFDGSNGNAYLGAAGFAYGNRPSLAFRPGARQLFMANPEVAQGYINGSVAVLHVTGRARLANLATRMRVGTGEAALISGLIVTGPAGSTKKVILRAIGPSLQRAGIADALSDTTLELVDAVGNSVMNDDWKIDHATGASQQAELEGTGLAPTSDTEAALVAELARGAYTAVMRGKAGTTGTGLVEVYDLDSASAGARLANIATRGHVGSGDAVMIGGMIVNGSGPSRILIRAIGPSLSGQLTDVLTDPVLELRNVNGELLEANDDWKSDHEAAIASTTIPPTDGRESAIIAGLFPGNYTAVVRGKGDSTGVALVETYYLQ